MRRGLFKKYTRMIHLWLGLITGLVVFIVSITGAIYVFQTEINLLFQAGVYKNVEKQDKPFISPTAIKEKSEEFFQQKIIYMTATVYPEGDRATVVWVRDSTRKYTAIVFNPYTGEVIHSYPYNVNFWAIILGLHTSLLIPGIGHHIVNISTILFVIMTITGLILWYPKQKKHLKQRLTIKWGASPRRLNYDLHNVLGFYLSWAAIIIALTGLVMAYQWMENSVYWLATAGETPQKQTRVKSDITNKEEISNSRAEEELVRIISSYDDLDNYFLEYAIDSADCYRLTMNTNKGYFYNRNDYYAIDQYTGETLKSDLWNNRNSGERIQAANLNIHIGAILGMPGKVLAFLSSLISASLPVTGFLIWRGRNFKKKKQPPKT